VNIVYFGSGAFGIPTLARLFAEHRLCAIVTQPDKPAGRSREPVPTPVGQWAIEHAPRVPVFKPAKVNEGEMVDAIRGLGSDAFVVIAFGQKLGRALLADRFAINLHASLLPRWRGAAPINHALLAGDARTGASVITLADQMDAGLILAQREREVSPLVTAGELHDALAEDGPSLVLGVLESHRAGTLRPLAQDPALVTPAPKLAKSDGWVDVSRPAIEARRRVQGLTPWPGVALVFRGETMKVIQCREEASPPGAAAAPGSLLDAESGLVAFGASTALRLLRVQPAGGREMTWADFARGRQPKVGEVFSSAAAVPGRDGAPIAG
jgi:methionyl-tRNA formyltransferase